MIGQICALKCALEPNTIDNGNGNCVCNWDSFLTSSCTKCKVAYPNSEGTGTTNKCRCSRGYQDTSINPPALICTPC